MLKISKLSRDEMKNVLGGFYYQPSTCTTCADPNETAITGKYYNSSIQPDGTVKVEYLTYYACPASGYYADNHSMQPNCEGHAVKPVVA
ncbi:MAG: hypothetical protein V4456_18895 [Bacteroidota bacterium]